MKSHQGEAEMPKMLTVGGATALLISVLLISDGPAQAGGARQATAGATKYDFTTLLDSRQDGVEPTRCAAINSSGTVAVTVRDTTSGVTRIITIQRPNEVPTVVADTVAAADFPTFCDNGFTSLPSDPSINDAGEVAFQGNLRRLTTRADCGTVEQRARRQGVFLGLGGPLTTIAHTINQPGGDFIAEFLVADQSVNAAGDVTLVPELDLTFQHGLFVGSKTGSFEQRFLAGMPTADGFNFSSISSRPSLNDNGQIAFQSHLSGTSVSGIFLSNPDGTFRTIVDTAGTFSSVFDPSLNNEGRVAFIGSRFDENFNQISSISISDGQSVTTVAESSPGGYATFAEPSLNEIGGVVFTAQVQRNPNQFVVTQGVFTGPDPRAHKVLQAGDRYEGERVTSVFTCAEALNNRGEIAMTVFSQNPETFEVRAFVVRASPRRLP
jgi:hypothetical protein